MRRVKRTGAQTIDLPAVEETKREKEKRMGRSERRQERESEREEKRRKMQDGGSHETYL